ncbi:MAG: LuxR C-terminal-related transcriptional regulator [Actinomycetota bacterium]|nr:LuxR C-terminal-related transcriptional regulator [Actinomycetota bacterium]
MSVDSTRGRFRGAAAQRHGLIDRPGLVSRLEESDRPLAMICAPAGYGKTTLLSQWAELDGRPFVSLTLGPHHNDPVPLVAAVCAALDDIEPLDDHVVAPLAARTPRAHEAVISRLGAALDSRRDPCVLAFDDVHVVTDPAALEAVGALGHALPSGSVMALASRAQPPLRIGRARASGALLEIGPSELAMTEVDAAALLAASGLELGQADVAQLVRRTEGWPAGLYLAALALLAADDLSEAVQRFAGDDRLVAEYLREEFLSTLSTDDRDFLARTSMLERLSGPVCDAVIGGEGSGETLRRLAHSNLLMVPMDRADETFRNHVLLRDMLRGDLRRRGEREERALNLRASQWYREHGDLEDAIGHAIAAGDVDAAGALIWEQAGTYETHGGHATLVHWLGEFSGKQVLSSPHLCLTMATSAIAMGDGGAVEHWTDVALEGASRLSASECAQVQAGAKALRAASGVAREGVAQMGADALEAASLIPADSPFHSLCLVVGGISRLLCGDAEQARSLLDECGRQSEVAAPTIQIVCLAHQALLAVDRGEVEIAAEQTNTAMALVEHYAVEDYTTNAVVYATSALTRVMRGDARQATQDVESSLALLRGLDSLIPWFEAETRVVVARALLLLDDADGARSQLGAAGKTISLIPDAVQLRAWIAAGWDEVENAATTGGRWPLTAAELRLVHFLPTHLSFKEIADELFVSPNTVKTQAKSIYRKFGVRSRAEAVACARSAGLLGTRDA